MRQSWRVPFYLSLSCILLACRPDSPLELVAADPSDLAILNGQMIGDSHLLEDRTWSIPLNRGRLVAGGLNGKENQNEVAVWWINGQLIYPANSNARAWNKYGIAMPEAAISKEFDSRRAEALAKSVGELLRKAAP